MMGGWKKLHNVVALNDGRLKMLHNMVALNDGRLEKCCIMWWR
jgi:hypothetical protein